MDEKQVFSIEQASWRDLQALIKLERVCFPRDAWPMIDLLGVLSFPGVVRLKAVQNGKMVGFIAGESRDHQKVGWIITLGVLKENRRQGVARKLLEDCELQLQTNLVKLCVRKSNQAAIQLYKEADYTQVEIWPQYYRGGEDALVLEKDIREKKSHAS